jgi:SpoVK/Ycf46/Vps4 family AAA+-type ATPase
MRVTRRGLLFPLEATDTRTWTKEAFRVVHELLAAETVGDEGKRLARALYMIASRAQPEGVAPDDAVDVVGRLLLRVYQAGMLHASRLVDDGYTGADIQARIREAAQRAARER